MLVQQSNKHYCRVRYAETDKAGMAHHSAYLIWFEVGRVEWLRALGQPYSDLEARGIHFPVREVSCRYRSPSFFDDLLCVMTTLAKVGKASVLFTYNIVRPSDDNSIADGQTLHACVDGTGRVQPLPAAIASLLRAPVTHERVTKEKSAG